MSFRDQALTIKNETIDGANTAERVGGLFEDYAEVIETVDTIADLRAFDTTNLTEGDQVYVKAHNTNGLNKGFGAGKFKWITTPVLTTNGSASSGDGNKTTDPTNEAVGGDGRPFTTNKFYGDNLIFTNGATATVTSNQESDPTSEIKSYGIGSTSVRMNLSGSVPDNTNAYFADDNGVYIRPTFTGFSGDGYWRRVLPDDGSVTYTMYGAIPQKSFRNDSPFDSYQAMQDAEDSLFDVKVGSGYYYTTQTVIHSRNKNVTFTGASVDVQISPDGHGRFFKYIESDIKAYIYADTDIDIYRLEASGNIFINVECRAIPTHTKRAVVVDGDEGVKGHYEVKVNGEIDSYIDGADGNTNGTRAFEIDLSEGKDLPETFSSVGAFSFNTVRVSAVDCYSGITSTLASGNGSFSNSLNLFLIGRRIVKPIELKSTATQTKIEGWYQEMSGVPKTVDQDIPVIYTNRARGCYVNYMTFDVDSTTHQVFLDVDSNPNDNLELGRMVLGPKCLTQPMISLITDRTFKYFDLATRLNIERYNITRFTTLHKKLEVSVTANEILNSNTTPINLLAGGSDVGGIVVQKAYLKEMSGTSNYTGNVNTTMELQANFDAGRYSHTAGTIDLTDLNINNGDKYWIPITFPVNNVNNNDSAPSVLRLITTGGDPAGGDAVFTIVVEYIEI